VPMLWDVATKKPFAQFLGLGDYEVKFTPDGKFVTVLSSDVLPRLWRVETTEELVTKGCKWIGDYLRNNSDVGKEDRKLCGPQTR
jgi:WD40 repeat protein